MNKDSIWNGYTVHGDVKELDFIANADGMVNLDKDDIVSILSSDGENWIAVGFDTNIEHAFDKTINHLPCKIDKVNSLVIDFRYGSKQPILSEFSAVVSALSDANTDLNIIWGVSTDKSLGESYKIILVASVKP